MVDLPRLHSSHAVRRLSSVEPPPAASGTTWSTCSTTPGALPERPQYRQRKPSRCRKRNRICARMGSRALRVRRPAGVSSGFAGSLPFAGYRRSFHTGAGRGPAERRPGGRLRLRATPGPTSCRSLIASASRASGALRREVRPRTFATIASSPHPAPSRRSASASDHPKTGCNRWIGQTSSVTMTSSARQPPPPDLRRRPIQSVSFPRRPLDPGQQHGPPAAALEGLDAMGRWA